MAEKIPIRVQHRRKSASAWRTSSEILLAGELGIESDTGKVKVGDGTSRFSSLQYLTGPKGEQGDTGPPGPRGATGDSLTVRSSRRLSSGNTQITFSDGNIVEVQKGQDGKVSLEDLSNEQIKQALGGVLNDYARNDHTHTSANISDAVTRIGTSANRNKIVQTNDVGHLEMSVDPTEGNHLVRKSYVDRAIREAIQNLNIGSAPPAIEDPPAERPQNNLPVMKTKNDFYQLTVEQVGKLSTLIDRAQNNIETINKVLSTHNLGNEIGVSGIQSVAIFRESKASYIARQWLNRNRSSDLNRKIDDAIGRVR